PLCRTHPPLWSLDACPTRRSSDLAVDPQEAARKRRQTFYREVPKVGEWTSPRGRTLLIRRDAMPDGSVVSLYSDITERKAGERQDRKSTRLNSSHEWSSYAVRCWN